MVSWGRFQFSALCNLHDLKDRNMNLGLCSLLEASADNYDVVTATVLLLW